MIKPIYLAVVTATLLAIGLRCIEARSFLSQTITLPNGEQYQYVGSSCDTVATPPQSTENSGKPVTLVNRGRQYETPVLFLWFQRVETKTHSNGLAQHFIARLADQDGVERGVTAHISFDDVTWNYFEFPVIPKRSKMLQCNLYPDDTYFHDTNAPVASITTTNPLYGKFPEWKPETLPAVKKVGDVEVRVENLMTGIRPSQGRFNVVNGKRKIDFLPANKGIRLETFVDVSLNSTSDANEEWMVHKAELSDSTGNVVRRMESVPVNMLFESQKMRPWNLPSDTKSFWTTLWPDETAWKLNLELKRFSGFASNELVTFRNVPLLRYSGVFSSIRIPSANSSWTQSQPITQFVTMTQHYQPGDLTSAVGGTNVISIPVVTSFYSLIGPTNEIWMTNSIGPFQVVLMEDMRWSPIIVSASGGPKFHVKIPNAPDDWEVDIVQMTTSSGEPVNVAWGNDAVPGIGNLTYEPFWSVFPPTNTTTVDIVCAVQKPRTAEFFVKPPDTK